MDGVGDTAGLEEIFLSIKKAWDKEWEQYEANSINLINLIDQCFDEEELRTFCKNLHVDYQNLPASGKVNKARELVGYLERRGRLNELIREGRRLRPKASWRELPPVMDESWQRVDLREAAQRYATHIRRECSTMRVFGQPEPVSLEGIFTDVYLLDRPTAWRRFHIEELQRQYRAGELPEHKVERKQGLEAVRSHQRLFILGKPGAGKTTFLKYMALQGAAGQIDKVPIFVSLKALADSEQELSDYVVSQFAACRLPDTQAWVAWLLTIGQGIVLFDGLDEVNQANNRQRRMSAAIEQFSRNYHDNQFLMTCRIAATDYNFGDFTYVEMADFTPAQVQAFVGKWFAQDEQKGEIFLAELAKPESERLQELARTPLLLALLCLAFHETMAFPQRRVEIYEEAIDALLKKWDSSRNIRRDEIYRDLSLGRKRQMFARIAGETFEKGDYFIPQRKLERMIVEYLRYIPPNLAAEEIDGEGVLKAIEAQHGIFIERARGIYSFAHLTFQEYFTARYLIENAAQGALDSLIGKHLAEPRWREVFLLTTSLLDNADGFFEEWLAALARIAAEPVMAMLVRWADASTRNTQADRNDLIAWRVSYLVFDFTLARALAHDRARALAFGHALSLALELAHALDRDYSSALPLNLDFARDLARSLADSRVRGRAFARARTHASTDMPQMMQKLIGSAQVLGLTDLQVGLAELMIPNERANWRDWRTFSKHLEQVIREHVPWQEEPLLSEQVEHIITYLQTNLLLLDCLQLGYVSDRKGIQNRMLLLSE